jgi:hypothetical protein
MCSPQARGPSEVRENGQFFLSAAVIWTVTRYPKRCGVLARELGLVVVLAIRLREVNGTCTLSVIVKNLGRKIMVFHFDGSNGSLESPRSSILMARVPSREMLGHRRWCRCRGVSAGERARPHSIL